MSSTDGRPHLVECVDHVIEELGPLATATTDIHGHQVRHPQELQLNEQERQLLDAMEAETVSIEALVVQTRIPVSRVLATLSVLESKKLVTRVSGTMVSRRTCLS